MATKKANTLKHDKANGSKNVNIPRVDRQKPTPVESMKKTKGKLVPIESINKNKKGGASSGGKSRSASTKSAVSKKRY